MAADPSSSGPRALELEPLEPRVLLSAALPQQALAAASTFMVANGQMSPADGTAVRDAATAWSGPGSVVGLTVQPLQDSAGADLAYVVQRDSGGYVVVAADDTVDPVLAYSWTGTFSWSTAADNPALGLIEGDIADQLQAQAASTTLDATALEATSLWAAYESGSPTLMGSLSPVESPWGPWISFPTFSQDAPYNDFVPTDRITGDKSAVGCVATSMAQIAYYWNYPASLSFGSGDSYVTSTESINVPGNSSTLDFPSFATLNSELATINYDFSKDELAYLSFACGIKAQMDYTSDSSGAYMSASLYLSGLDFGSASWSTSWSAAQSKVIQDIKNGWPAQLEISGPDGIHSVVLDGYTDDGAFHVNMGWGGDADAWYMLPNIVPANPNLPGFDVIDGVIYDITPYSSWVSVNNVTSTEGNSGSKNFAFNVTLSQASTQTVTLDYATADGTATAGSDYTAVSGTLTFNPGQTSQTINVPVLGDTTPELNETFYLNLTHATNATIAGGQAVGTIQNDDGAPPATIWPTAPFYAPPDRTLYTNQNGDATIGGYSLGTAGDLDGFHVYFDAAGAATFSTTGSVNTAIGLYDGVGAPVMTNGGTSPTTSATLSTTVTAGQELDLLVRGYGDTTTGSYGLTVNGPAPTVSAIAVSDATNIGSATGTIADANDYAFYSFTPTEDGEWTVNLTPTGDFHPTMVVYDSSGTPVRGNFTVPMDTGVAGASDTYSAQLTAGSTWYVRVDGSGTDTGDFTLSVQGPWPNGPVDAGANQTVYVNQYGDATLAGNPIAAAGDESSYHVFFSKSGSATFQTTGSTDTVMGYYSSAGLPALTDDESGTGANALISAKVPAVQDLELLVGGYGASTGAYGLSVAGPSAAVSSIAIAQGGHSGSANGSIGSASEYDFFSFTAPVAGSWTVTLNPSASFHSTLEVYDSSGNPVGCTFTAPIDAGLAGASDAWTGTLNAGDTEYVRVDGLGSATGTYSLLVQGPADHAPTLTSISPLTGGVEDTDLTISYSSLLAASNMADSDSGDTLSFRVAAVSSGTLTKNGTPVVAGTTLLSAGQSLVWHPAANANGTLNAFTVTAWDGELASAAPLQVSVQVQPVNDAPTATAQSVRVAEDVALPITLGGSDVETPAGSLIYTIASGPAHGDLLLAGNVATYTPNTGYLGADSFTFTVTDNGDPAGSDSNPGDLVSAPATVSLNVAPAYRSVGVITGPTGAQVYVFDCDSTADVTLSNIAVKFGTKGSISSITLGGTQAMGGLGIGIVNATSVGSIKDSRKGTLGRAAFIASNAPVSAIQLKSGMSGVVLDGMAIGGWTLPTNPDGDSVAYEQTALYTSGALGSLAVTGSLAGDVYVGGALGTLSVTGGVSASADVHATSLSSLLVTGGDFAGDVEVTGNLQSVQLKGGKSGGGNIAAGAQIHAGGLIGKVSVSGGIAGADIRSGGQLQSLSVGANMFNASIYGGTLGKITVKGRISEDGTDGDTDVVKALGGTFSIQDSSWKGTISSALPHWFGTEEALVGP